MAKQIYGFSSISPEFVEGVISAFIACVPCFLESGDSNFIAFTSETVEVDNITAVSILMTSVCKDVAGVLMSSSCLTKKQADGLVTKYINGKYLKNRIIQSDAYAYYSIEDMTLCAEKILRKLNDVFIKKAETIDEDSISHAS